MTKKLNLLLAYPYFDQANIDLLKNTNTNKYRLIVDSGAFTAWNTGKKIELDDYCRFLDKIEFLRPFNAVQLDVFGNPDETFKNLIKMKSRGYEVMPVFTRGDSLERLEEMYEFTDYIMFGGIVIGGSNKNYVKWFLNKNKNRKAHWLGFVNIPFIKMYKPESVDSSSWTGAARFGNMGLYYGNGLIKTLSKKDFAKKPSIDVLKNARKIGIEMDQLSKLGFEETWTKPWYFDGKDWSKPKPGMAQFVSTLSHLKRSIEVEKNLGTKVYLAGNHDRINKTLLWAQEYLASRGII